MNKEIEKEMLDMFPQYRIWTDGVVEIQERTNYSFRLDCQSILVAIENVKRERDSYATEKAFQRRLSVYERALTYLDAASAV